MSISFGAKILTSPEQFYLKTDTPADKKEIQRFIGGLKFLAENPIIDRCSPNDTVSLRRSNSKYGHLFFIDYNSHDIKNVPEFRKIHMFIQDFSIGNILETFRQITLPMMAQKGCFRADRSLFTPYNKNFIDTFGLSFSDFIKSLKR